MDVLLLEASSLQIITPRVFVVDRSLVQEFLSRGNPVRVPSNPIGLPVAELRRNLRVYCRDHKSSLRRICSIRFVMGQTQNYSTIHSPMESDPHARPHVALVCVFVVSVSLGCDVDEDELVLRLQNKFSSIRENSSFMKDLILGQ